jgi:molybdopterin converting factor small subunit
VQVTVKLHGILRDYRPPGFKGDVLNLDLDDGATVLSVSQRIGIPRKVLHAAFLNDEQVGVDAALKDGDFLRLFPPVVGG